MKNTRGETKKLRRAEAIVRWYSGVTLHLLS